MSHTLNEDGFEIRRGVLSRRQIATLRLEADAVASSAGSACVRHLRSRSKIFDDLSISSLIRQLIPDDLRPVRSILFDKTPEENWPVTWHQDLTIAVSEKREIPGYGPWSYKDGATHVQPPLSLLENMVTIRLHLDDTLASNGALRVIPGTHKKGRISTEKIIDFQNSDDVICECMSGDALMMSPLLLHSSRRALTPSRRRRSEEHTSELQSQALKH